MKSSLIVDDEKDVGSIATLAQMPSTILPPLLYKGVHAINLRIRCNLELGFAYPANDQYMLRHLTFVVNGNDYRAIAGVTRIRNPIGGELP
jgi:hypothetical protein